MVFDLSKGLDGTGNTSRVGESIYLTNHILKIMIEDCHLVSS